MLFGAHVSSAGGLWNAPKNAAEIGCEVLQMFSRPPQGGKPKPITEEVTHQFKEEMEKYSIKHAYIHAPYFINLASSNERIRHGSIAILREELERGSLLGCKGMMFHPGSAKDVGQEEGELLVIAGLNTLLDGYEGSCQLLIEISAGAGMVMGDTFEELARFLHEAKQGKQIGICFDTQHAFASGYDIRTQKGLDNVLIQFDQQIGLQHLIASHCNDSKVDLGTHKDRHEHLGEGFMGLETFKQFIHHPKIQHLDLILETPIDGQRKKEIELLKTFRLETQKNV
ncbi:MAG: putative endonuclease 4 [Candidatus Uhrbacteria bacterium GW2011_GWF2_39_13]|uniref:Probable endonuclease 4 n=1 Tax=Candidatus Uhrbacteria bacterium GW2011_GWF2_39_13 TaxID=1618995 RepID=A0A0G0QRM5_9BACT|nr:MAG: putative endonuclease 4 [Candidatus Uhrbacteria bacterium GW2011_GWF2_39_13]HAU65816.1 hypothetical protein [Candidatus Uhrbacteria bacterium]